MFLIRLLIGVIMLQMVAHLGYGQLVNIESRRIHNDTIRKAGNALLSAAYQDNANVRVLALKAAVVLQLKSTNLKDMYMFLGNADWTTVNNNDVVNAVFTHLRYNRKLTEVLRWEVFTQFQYNKLLNMDRRWLTGTGPRFKLVNHLQVHAYLGSLYMFEYEAVSGEQPVINHHHRSSSYLSVTVNLPQSHAEVISTAYFQPRFVNFNDYRVTWQTAVTFQITKKLRWISSFNYLYDAFPPSGIAPRAISFDQGIRVDF
jgi:hypothetical protein